VTAGSGPPSGDGLVWRTATELARLLASGELSSVELTGALIERSDAVDPGINAYLHRTDELALEAAGAADARRRSPSRT
jgi:aspartyl-tRNA(Asn)/glutamyl-tRNA(Gln) amidotransferase subunit A